MKKILFSTLVLVLFGVFSCKPSPTPPAPPTPEPVNPLEGAWTISSVVLDETLLTSLKTISGLMGIPIDLEGNLLNAIGELGMDCMSEGQLIFAKEEEVSFALCSNSENGTYTYDEDGNCTLTVEESQISEEPISVDGTFTETELTFVIKDLLATVPDFSDLLIEQIEAEIGTLNPIVKGAIQIFLSALKNSTGEVTFVKEVAE